MARIFLLLVLGGLGAWAYVSASRGPSARSISNMTMEEPERVTFRPIIPYVPPPSNRTGSTRGPRVGGGGPSSGK